jgi:PAS domain S-box-containing protein
MKDNVVKWVIGLFLVVLAILGVVAVVSIRNIQRSMATSNWVNHTHATILEVDAVLSALHAGDAALKTFFLSGDARDQASYRLAYSEMKRHLVVAKTLTRQEAYAAQSITNLELLLAKHMTNASKLAKARQEGGLDAVRKQQAADAGDETLLAIENYVKELKADAQLQLVARDKASYLAAQTTRWTVLAGLGINFVLLALAAIFVKDDIAARRKATAVLREANEQLEAKVQERTAELAKANASLREENLQHRWSNQALEHQLRYNQLIINSISDLVFVISKASNVTRINSAVVISTGFQAAELVGFPLHRVVRLSSAEPGNGDALAAAMSQGRELHDAHAALVDKVGKTMPVQLSLFPLRDKDKVVGGVVTLQPARTTGSATDSTHKMP